MSRYSSPYCNDEDLLEELNKLGFDEVPPGVLNKMKDDLSEFVEQAQDDPPHLEYDNGISPSSSKVLSALSDAAIESPTKQQTGKKNSSVSRKVKKKSPNKTSRAKKDHNSEKIALESSRCQNTVLNDPKLKNSSNVSLDYVEMYDLPVEDTLADIEVLRNKYNSVEEPKSTENYLALQNSNADINKNEDLKFKNSRAKKNRNSEKITLESSRCQNAVNKPKLKNSSVSLDYDDRYDVPVEDTLADIDVLRNKYNSVEEPKSTENYLALQNSNTDINRNEDLKYKNSRSKKNRNSEKIASESSRCQNTVNKLKLKNSSSVSLDYDDMYDAPIEDALADMDGLGNKYNSVEDPKSTDNYSALRSSKADINRNEDLKYKNSWAKKDQNDSEKITLESSRCQNTVNELNMKSSLDYENMYDIPDEDTLVDIDGLGYKYNSVDEPKSTNNYSALQSSKADVNRNEDCKYKHISNYKSKPIRNHQTKNDRYPLNSDISESRQRNNVLNGNKHTNSFGKSYGQAYSLCSPRKTANNSSKILKNAFKLEKNSPESEEFLRNYRGSDINLNTSQSSTSYEMKTMKRKVLRRRNGRSVITEELVEVPDIFDTSYPESENFSSGKSFSSDDLSFKSNSSTGSTTAVSPESIKSSPSTFSLLSTRSTSLRVANSRKKKSDPVAMYGYYRKFWDNFKPPGENTHDKLRWAVRDKMLEYNI